MVAPGVCGARSVAGGGGVVEFAAGYCYSGTTTTTTTSTPDARSRSCDRTGDGMGCGCGCGCGSGDSKHFSERNSRNKTEEEESLLLTHARSCRCGGPRASWWHGPLLLSERHARARPARGHRWESGRARRSAPVGRVRNRDRRADFFDDEPRPRALRALRALRIERIERTRLVVVCGRTTSSSRSCG